MDEIWFRLSTQIETLQIQTAVISQQGQQHLTAWMEQGRQLLQELYSEQYVQRAKDIVQYILAWIQRGYQQLQFEYSAIQFNIASFYNQLKSLSTNRVTKREIVFCLAGLVIGTLLGYFVGINWRQSSHYLHCMKAIICHHYIGIEGVSMIEDAEMPSIQKSNELMIQVKAASVNVVDTKICCGYSKVYRRLLNNGRHRELPVTLGRDCSGVVVETGRGVVNFDVGDEVFLAVPSWAPGTMAEYLVVPESIVVKRPKFFSFEAATSIPYSGCLAWDALVKRSVIKEGNAKGMRVLVFGSSSPVGCIIVQLVKSWGGHVVATCRSHAIPIMKALGADDVIGLGESDIDKELQAFDRFDAIFYTGGDQVEEHVLKKHLLPYGSYVSTVPEHLTSDSLGFIFGSIFAGCVRVKLLVQYMFGFNTLQWREGSKIKSAYLQALCDLADGSQLQAVVDRVYAPHNIEQALHHIVDPDAIGSTVIKFQ